MGPETSARHAYELESSSVKEAAMLVWANGSVRVKEVDGNTEGSPVRL